MTTQPEEQKREDAPSVPDGTPGASYLSSHQERYKVYRAFIRRYGAHAAVVLTLILAWYRSARKKGLGWCFRSYTKLAEQIPGLEESAVRRQSQKLARAGAVRILPGSGGHDFSPSPRFQVQSTALGLIDEHAAGDEGHADSLALHYGAEDAEHFGIETALFLAYIEYHKERDPAKPVACRLSRVASYLGLKTQTVQRIVKHLLINHKLVEDKVEDSAAWHRYLDFHPDWNRKPVFSPKEEGVADVDRDLQITAPCEVPAMGCRPAADLATSCDTNACTSPEDSNGTTRKETCFKDVVQRNCDRAEHPTEHEVSLVRSWIERMNPEDFVRLGQMTTDEITAIARCEASQANLPTSMAGTELVVLALQLRRHPELLASSPQIRRTAYELSLRITERLQEIRQLRIDLVKQHQNQLAEEADLPPSEKVAFVLEAIEHRNRVGVEGPTASGCQCPNPPILYDRFEGGGQGRAEAGKFFERRPSLPASEVIRLLDQCSRVPLKPHDPYARDDYYHSRAGVRLSYLVSKFDAILRELS